MGTGVLGLGIGGGALGGGGVRDYRVVLGKRGEGGKVRWGQVFWIRD